MAQFYICHPVIPNTNARTTSETHNSITDLLCASKIVSKAALKISEIPIKLQMARVSRFLEQSYTQWQNLKKKVLTNTVKSSQKNSQLITDKEAQVITQIPSVLNMYTSNSLSKGDVNVSCLTSNQDHYDELTENRSKVVGWQIEDETDQQNNSKNLGGILKWRQVVTKNVLEEFDRNKIVRFKEDKCQCKENQQDYNFKVMQKQLKLLKGCFQKMLAFFQNEHIINLQQMSNNSHFNNYDKMCSEVIKNYRNFHERQQQEISNLIDSKNKYLSVLQQISNQLKPNFNEDRAEKQQHQGNQIFSNRQLQILQSQVEMVVKELNRLHPFENQSCNYRKRCEEMQQKLKKYQMLLFIKDEQIQSLNTIKSNLENRFSAVGKVQERPRSRSYKKFFENLDDKLSSTYS